MKKVYVIQLYNREGVVSKGYYSLSEETATETWNELVANGVLPISMGATELLLDEEVKEEDYKFL